MTTGWKPLYSALDDAALLGLLPALEVQREMATETLRFALDSGASDDATYENRYLRALDLLQDVRGEQYSDDALRRARDVMHDELRTRSTQTRHQAFANSLRECLDGNRERYEWILTVELPRRGLIGTFPRYPTPEPADADPAPTV